MVDEEQTLLSKPMQLMHARNWYITKNCVSLVPWPNFARNIGHIFLLGQGTRLGLCIQCGNSYYSYGSIYYY